MKSSFVIAYLRWLRRYQWGHFLWEFTIGKYAMRVSELCESQTDLDEISRQAEHLGVNMQMFWDSDSIWLHEIDNSGPKGSGRKALEMLLRYADQVRLPVRGSVVSFNEQLLNWYAKLGFRVISEEDDDGYVVIERSPSAKSLTNT